MEVELIVKRIEEIMTHYHLTAASFADSIGVQRSSISHLLKGRNKPSLEFVCKITEVYTDVDLYWLLYGEGDLPTKRKASLNTENIEPKKMVSMTPAPMEIEKIVTFYRNGTFSTHFPKKQ